MHDKFENFLKTQAESRSETFDGKEKGVEACGEQVAPKTIRFVLWFADQF